MRLELFFVAVHVTIVTCAGCAEPATDARRAEIVSVMTRADEAALLARPRLVAGKYARTASDAFSFFRGTLPLFAHDLRDGAQALAVPPELASPLVVSIGDPHPENFGVLRASDGTLALEPNDFDAADVAPPGWDLHRLATGLCLAARWSNADDAKARAAASEAAVSVAAAAIDAWSGAIDALAKGAPRARVMDGSRDPVFSDLLARSARDGAKRAELTSLTVLDGATRRFIRGPLSPADPENALFDVPLWVLTALPETLTLYRETLVAPPDPQFFEVLDVTRELGSGVASWAKIRLLVLVRGATDDPADDVVLELKELTDASLGAWIAPREVFDDVGARVTETSRVAWARPDADPLWGTSRLAGIPVQLKTESEGQKTARVAKLTGDRGTPDALRAFGAELGALLARVHASTPARITPDVVARLAASVPRDRTTFVASRAEVACAWASRVEDDLASFRSALVELGPTLGVTSIAADAPSSDLRALLDPETASP